MKLENTPELLAAIETNDTLTAQLAEFETTKTNLETATTALAEMTVERDALQTENGELKTAAAASEEVGKQIQSEVAKNVELTDKLKAAEESVTGKDTEILELQGKVTAFEAVATTAVDEKVALEAQVELVAEQLGPKALVPDVEEAGSLEETPASYKTWMKLSLSKNPEDKRMARRMQKDNPDIDGFIRKQSGTPSSTITPATKTFTDEQVKIFAEWKAIRADAEANKKNHTIHATKVVEARRMYKQHQSIIDAQINAAQSA